MDSDLVDVSNATVCVVGVGDCGLASGTNQVSGVTGATTFTGLIGLVQSPISLSILILAANYALTQAFF